MLLICMRRSLGTSEITVLRIQIKSVSSGSAEIVAAHKLTTFRIKIQYTALVYYVSCV